MGLAYLTAVMRDRVVTRAVRVISALGFLLAMVLHVGAENMGLEIGWFSYYMIAMGCCFLLPLRAVELLAAVALRRPEHVSGEALAMDANEHRLRGMCCHITGDQGNVFMTVVRPVGHDAKLTEVRGETRIADTLHAGDRFRHAGTRP